MNRKTKFLKTVLLLATLLVGTHTASAYDFEVDGIYYQKYHNYGDGDSVYVTYGSSSSNSYRGDVVIPENVTYSGKTYRVKGVGKSAFYNCTALTSIVLPNTIIEIRSDPNYCGAFEGCVALTSIDIPNSVISIGEKAFWKCI